MTQHVTEIKEVPNKWDREPNAYKVMLSCGHHFFVTGHKIFNIKSVECKTCGDSGRVNYHE